MAAFLITQWPVCPFWVPMSILLLVTLLPFEDHQFCSAVRLSLRDRSWREIAGWDRVKRGRRGGEDRIQPSIGSEKGNSSFRAVRVRRDSWDYLKKIGTVNGREPGSHYPEMSVAHRIAHHVCMRCVNDTFWMYVRCCLYFKVLRSTDAMDSPTRE